jgi:hypothetical protein
LMSLLVFEEKSKMRARPIVGKFWYHCKIFYFKYRFIVHQWFSDEQLHMLEEAFFLKLRIKVTKRQ